MSTVRILLISGSTRAASNNTALLRTAQLVAPPGVVATLYSSMTDLPHFNPDDDVDSAGGAALHPVVANLRAAMAACHGVFFSTPEYAGAMPGTFKNLLDWTVGGGELYRKPVAWLNPSSSLTGASHALASLITVLGFLDVDLVQDACARIPVLRSQVNADGLIVDEHIRQQLATALSLLVAHVAQAR
jgi:chromate reductase